MNYYDEFENQFYNPDDDDVKPGLNLNWKKIQRGFKRVENTYHAYVTPQMFGAKADGITDDTTAIQRALNSLENIGGTVYFPAGQYVVTTIIIPNGVSIKGEYSKNNNTPEVGSVLYCVDQNNSAVILTNANEVSNFAFYYPDLRFENDSFNIEYPHAILIKDFGNANSQSYIHDILFYNAYQGIKAEPVHGVLTIENVSGYCAYNCIDIDGALDVVKIRNCHFSYTITHAIDTPENVNKYGNWTRSNGIAFRLGRLDWGVIESCFVWGYYIGVQTYAGYQGINIGNTTFNNVNIDSCGICFDLPYGWSLTFNQCVCSTGNYTFDDVLPDYGIIIGVNATGIVFDTCIFTGFNKGVFDILGDLVTLSNNIFRSWGEKSSESTFAVNVQSGVIVLNANTFVGDHNARQFGIKNINGSISIIANMFNSFTNPVYSGAAAFVLSVGNKYNNVSTNNQLKDLYRKTDAVILSSNSPYQIPNDLLEYNMITIMLRRFGYYGSVTIAKDTITGGGANVGIEIRTGSGSDAWNIAISNGGIITLTNATTSSVEPYVEILGAL